MRRKLLGISICLATAWAIAQMSPEVEVEHAPYAGVREWVGGAYVTPIPNLPFTAKVVIATTQTLADQTTVSKKTWNVIARDSHGRTHNEGRQLVPLTDNSEPRILRELVYDPQSRTNWAIYPSERLVRVCHCGVPSPTLVSTPSGPLPSGITSQKVELGKQFAEGLELHGTRETRFYPIGLSGNERAFEVVDEFWYSPDLQINVIVRHNDPRTGTQTVSVTEITRTEPDTRLFEVPSDYRQVNEPGTPGKSALEPGVTPPRKISGSPAGYTDAARREKVQGTVVLSVLISEDGMVKTVSVVRSLRSDLDQSAMDTIRSWRFQPAMKNGAPIEWRGTIETTFRLY